MKSIKHIFGVAATTLALAVGFTGCQDDFDTPPIVVPEATIKPNVTIAELKAKYWQDDNNYYLTVGQNDQNEDYVVHGRVVSSDATGNIYKSLVIQDETGALAFSVNQNSLYSSYRIGQEVVVNVTGLGIGKYSGLQQIGGYGEFNGTPQVSFMASELFKEHAQLNGLPNQDLVYVTPDAERPADKMYCIEADLKNLPQTAGDLQKMQSQLVIFRNVYFEEGGKATFADPDANTNRTLSGVDGGSIIVRNSSYASFKNEMLPSGTGDVMGILSYFNGNWQLLLRSSADCLFDTKGQKADPYNVAEAIELQGTGKTAWVKGFIVGSVKAGVSDIDSDSKIAWGATADLDNTLVIGATADTKSLKDCLVMELPQGSDLRKYGNLLDHPELAGRSIEIYGAFDSFMGTAGILNNKGAASEFAIEGVTVGGGGTQPGEAVASLFCDFEGYNTKISELKSKAGWNYTATSGDKDWYLKEFSGNVYAAATAYKGTSGPWEEWLVSPGVDLSKSPKKSLEFECQAAYRSATSNLEVYAMTSQDPRTAQLTKLNVTLPDIPASGYSSWVKSNVDLSSFSGVIYIGWKYSGTSADGSSTYCIDNVNIGGATETGGGSDTPDTPTEGVGSKDKPYTVAQVKATSSDVKGVWVEGWVVGWISGKAWATGATFSSTVSSDFTNTNFIMGGSADAKTVDASVPCAIPAGALRDKLGLGKNPAIYLKHVRVLGNITAYFGQRGVKDITEYEVID